MTDQNRTFPQVDLVEFLKARLGEDEEAARSLPEVEYHSVWTFPGEDWTPCRTLKILAAIWAEHPDFDPSWTVAD